MKSRPSPMFRTLATLLLPLFALVPLTGCFEKEKIIEPYPHRADTHLTVVAHDRGAVELPG
jgi:hypothetical protein